MTRRIVTIEPPQPKAPAFQHDGIPAWPHQSPDGHVSVVHKPVKPAPAFHLGTPSEQLPTPPSKHDRMQAAAANALLQFRACFPELNKRDGDLSFAVCGDATLTLCDDDGGMTIECARDVVAVKVFLEWLDGKRKDLPWEVVQTVPGMPPK
jgi:hypothetical protein